MNRRSFMKRAGGGLASASLWHKLIASEMNVTVAQSKIINAYYFRAHMYTLVPRHVREDLKWMADIGTNVVSLAILEQDLVAAKENVDFICNEANKLNIAVYAVPSRWAGLFAGAPKVPSPFAVNHPHTWILDETGNAPERGVFGPYSSIHYPETLEFFQNTLGKMLEIWPLKGVIWDEPKIFTQKDYSPRAIEHLGPDAPIEKHCQTFIDFLSTINLHIKKHHPEIITSMFGYAHLPTWVIEQAVTTKGLDYFGCDGRPWHEDDGGKVESEGKVLLGKTAGERFLSSARKNGKRSLWLIENHNMRTEDIPRMETGLPEVLSKDIDHLIYYYYPRNLEDPDRNMAVIGRHIKEYSYK